MFRTEMTVFLLLLCGLSPVRAQQSISKQLGLNPGNYWVYSGSVTWTIPGEQPRSNTENIQWKVSVVAEVRHGELQAYLLDGSFDDLPWFQPGKERGEYLWMVYRDRFFMQPADPKLLRRFHDNSDSLLDVIQQAEPVLQFPLFLQRCTETLEPSTDDKRDDLFYCWHLEQRSTATLKIAGIPRKPVPVWTAWYQSNPDHQILEFAPGVGFISYDFSHHGTLSEAHVKLTEAHLR